MDVYTDFEFKQVSFDAIPKSYSLVLNIDNLDLHSSYFS